MIRFNYISAIIKKEILDTVRDKKTMIITIALPLVVWPLSSFFVIQFSSIQVTKQESKTSKVAFIGEQSTDLSETLGKDEKFEIVSLENLPNWTEDLFSKESPGNSDLQSGRGNTEKEKFYEHIEMLIADKKLDILIAHSQESLEKFKGVNRQIFLLFDSTNTDSSQALARMKPILDDLESKLIQKRINELDLSQNLLNPFLYQTQNVASKSKTTADILGRILPLMLIFLVILGGFYPAINMTAGEKEHGTLPTILCAPITHLELLFGKYISVLLIALVGVSANILSICAVAFIGLAELSLNISSTTVFLIFISLIPVAMLFTALFMAVAIFANSFREGQNLLSPVTLIAILPAYSTLFPGVELTPMIAITPGFNIALLIKEILVQAVDSELILFVLLSNLAWTLGILTFTAKIFRSEEVLICGKASLSDVFTLDRSAFPEPTAYLSTLLFVVILSGTFYLSGILLQFGIVVLVPILQLGLFAGLPYMISRYFRMDMAEVFRLKRPKILQLLGAFLVGISLFLVVQLFSKVIEAPEGYEKSLVKALQLQDKNMSFYLLLLLIAILPGICEEFAFRGIILSGYQKRLQAKWAILLTGFWFACAHFSVYNILPLFFMGTVLSYIAWKTQSIWPGVLVHILNNSIGVALARFEQELTTLVEDVETLAEAPLIFVIASMITLLGLMFIKISSERSEDRVGTEII